jgi:RNA polymerase sigma factor (sigma-70 family)
MHPRKNLLELFATFLNLSGDRSLGWLTDARLQRHMQQCMNANGTAIADFWVVYWHQQWQQTNDRAMHSYCEGHLSAYLQETCYWSVKRVMPRQGSGQFQLSDYFQVAIAEVPKLLQKFDSTQRGSLNAYANRAFGNLVRDYLRQRREVDFCSDWSLLLKVSRKRFLEALQRGGLDQPNCDRLLLAWTCFEEVYLPTKAPGLRQITAPDAVVWQEVVARYDRQRQSLPATTPEKLERDLLQAAKQIRNLLYPAIQSLNLPKGGEMGGEIQDDLPNLEQDSLLSGLILQENVHERQQQMQQMRSFLETTIDNLTQQTQTLLKLYYGDRLKQREIAKSLDIQQYTVSRQLTKTREGLLQKIIQWAQETWHISPDSTVVDSVSTLLEAWLEQHYMQD